MQSAIFCCVNAGNVGSTIRELEKTGIPARDISVLCPDVPGLESAYAGSGAVTSATSLIVAGIGPCVVSGPVARMLVGTPAGRLVGGLTAALVDLVRLIGISESDQELFERQLRGGRGLVLVHYSNPEHRGLARQVFEGLGTSDVHTSGRAARTARAGPPPAEPAS